MKLLLDPRRSRILELAQEPITVGELAEQIGELPSRVYYHVHKLEEAGLLELVETRQHGNLIEKLYQCKDADLEFSLQPTAFEHLPAFMKEFEELVIPGLRLLEHAAKIRTERIKEDPEDTERHPGDPQVTMSISWDTLTRSAWRAKLERLNDIAREEGQPGTAPERTKTAPATVYTDDDETGRYAFVTLSYRLEDAEKLGFYVKDRDDEE